MTVQSAAARCHFSGRRRQRRGPIFYSNNEITSRKHMHSAARRWLKSIATRCSGFISLCGQLPFLYAPGGTECLVKKDVPLRHVGRGFWLLREAV